MQARLEESERDGAKDSEEDFAGTLHAELLIQEKFFDDTRTIPGMMQLCVTRDLKQSPPRDSHASAEALKKDMKLLDSSTQEAGKGKTLVPKAIDADDDDDPGEADDDSEDDDEVRRDLWHKCGSTLQA